MTDHDKALAAVRDFRKRTEAEYDDYRLSGTWADERFALLDLIESILTRHEPYVRSATQTGEPQCRGCSTDITYRYHDRCPDYAAALTALREIGLIDD